jgi:hypothetical protein
MAVAWHRGRLTKSRTSGFEQCCCDDPVHRSESPSLRGSPVSMPLVATVGAFPVSAGQSPSREIGRMPPSPALITCKPQGSDIQNGDPDPFELPRGTVKRAPLHPRLPRIHHRALLDSAKKETRHKGRLFHRRGRSPARVTPRNATPPPRSIIEPPLSERPV